MLILYTFVARSEQAVDESATKRAREKEKEISLTYLWVINIFCGVRCVCISITFVLLHTHQSFFRFLSKRIDKITWWFPTCNNSCKTKLTKNWIRHTHTMCMTKSNVKNATTSNWSRFDIKLHLIILIMNIMLYLHNNGSFITIIILL